ncbi:hypothetical protein [Acidovorax sp. sic0104]|uniref:hypothetical protein n=1 Tax=Acidovorax sp. sic0104 TaxID=2854784 RepID=UPI001C453C67|nr:hypothetical protein [Acidovorax sp. sic0104]MBV7540480.1 hypothetical protein [Acidovorax sp. sic0104]
MLYILSRILSPYDAADVFIGAFATFQKAQAARKAVMELWEQGDPYSKQSYRIADLQADLIISEITDIRLDDSQAFGYIVSEFCDSHSMLTRSFLSAHSSHEDAEAFVKRHKLEESPCIGGIFWHDILTTKINPELIDVLHIANRANRHKINRQFIPA